MRNIIILSLFLFFSIGVRGQEVLTLQQCREMAIENNKQMESAVKQTEGARYMQKSYKGNFFPNFTAYARDLYATADWNLNVPDINLPVFMLNNPKVPVGFAYIPSFDLDLKVNNLFMAGVQVEQPIFMGGKIVAAYKMSKLGTELSLLNEHLTASEVILQTENAYAMLVKAQEMKKVALSYKSLLEELLGVIESAYKHGLKPKNDVLKVKVKQNECELNISRADNACRLAMMNLCHMIGKPLTAELQIEAVYPHVPNMGDIAAANIIDRPEYAMLDKKVAIAEQEVRLQRSEMLPKIGVRGSYDYTNGVKVNNQKIFDDGGFSVMVNVTVPLFHFGTNYNKVRSAKAKLEQTKLEQEYMNEAMLLELTQAENNLNEARLEVELADRSLEQTAENLRVSRGEYDAGLEILSDLLEAQTLWQEAYATQVDARFQMYLQYVKYLKAAGKLQK